MNNLPTIKKYSIRQMEKYCNTHDLDELHKLKLHLDDLYYNTDETELPDTLYDILKDTLTKRDPNYIPPVGAKIRKHENRVKIPFWMGSANKITPNEPRDLIRWIDNNKCDSVVISEKLDGVSGTLVYKNGKRKLYTRGNGVEGSDISYLIQYIDSIPDIDTDIAVRGELIIKKDVFTEKYYSGGNTDNKKGRLYKNARNMVSGLVGAKTVRVGLIDIDFVVYEIVGNKTMPRPSMQFKKLKKLGFTPAMNKKIDVSELSDMNRCIDLHNTFKNESIYEIDGIVIQSNVRYDRNTSGNPSYLFAFKVLNEDNIFPTTVLDIEWSVSSWGQIVPVAIIEPIELPGNTIKRVTISNAGLMKQKGIGPGAIINVTRSKEVIPFIVSVIKKCEELKWPEVEYKWDDNNVHLNVINANDETVAEMNIKTFSKFFMKMGIKHVNKQTISKLYMAGFDTLVKILSATETELVKIDGIQKKSAERIVKNIREGLQNIKMPELLGSCGVFGFGIGRKRIISLMTDIPDILSIKSKGLKERIMKVEGFSDIMADKVISNIENAKQFVDDINKHVSFVDNTRVSDKFVGMKFVFSGFRSKELEQQIEDRGGKITTSVSKNTSGIIVISNEKNVKQSSKVEKAIKLGVTVYTHDDFIEKFI